MSEKHATGWLRRILLVPPIALGIAVLAFVISNKEPPARKDAHEYARNVRIIEATPGNVVPRAVGFGTVAPPSIWQAVAHVGGKVVWVNPEFRKGVILAADTEIVRIDPSDYKLAIAEAEANIASAEATLDELKVSQDNAEALLELERRSLDLRVTQLDRISDLLAQGTTTQASADAEQRNVLSQRVAVRSIENSLRLFETQTIVQQQQIAVNQSKLATARLQLERTVLKLPYRARVSEVGVEETQFVQPGAKLGSADDISIAEIEAQLSLTQMGQFVSAVSSEDPAETFSIQAFGDFAKRTGMRAVVRFNAGFEQVEWKGRVARLSDEIDPQTRTLGVVAQVDRPYDNIMPGLRPPLNKGMFVEVELRAAPLHDRIVVPQSALHDGSLYIAGPDNRLHIRKIKSGFSFQGMVVVEEFLKPGEKVVVSDLSPAVEGMLLELTMDAELAARIAELGAGE